MKRYVITNTVQSGDNSPVDITWYRGEDHVQALAALVSAGAQTFNEAVPESLRLTLLSVRMDVHEVEPGASSSTGQDGA